MTALSNVKLTLVESMADAEDLMRWLGERREVLGVDTETGGLDWWRDGLRTVQVGDTEHGWVIPYPLWGGLAKEVLQKWQGDYVMHNAKFDLHFLRQEGIMVDRSRVHDTRIMAHLVDNIGSTSLKSLTARHVDRGADRLQHMLKEAMTRNKWKWSTIPYDYSVYWQYAALDTVLTARICEIMWPLTGEARRSYDIELAAQQVLQDAERRGILIDKDYCQRESLGMRAAMEDLNVRAQHVYGIKSLGRPKGIIDKLRADGVHFTRFTEKGQESLDKIALQAMSHPLAAEILEYRHFEKVSGTYLENFIEMVDQDSVLHASINPLGARTGRMSVSRPSLQNLERSSDVRDAFIARPNHTLLMVDYDQIEMRLLAHYALEMSERSGATSRLYEIFDQDVDPFTAMARQVQNEPDMDKGDPRRQTMKNAMYAKIYGAGIEKLAVTAGTPLAEMVTFMGDLDTAYPEIDRFIDAVQSMGHQRASNGEVPYVTTPYKRRLSLSRGDGIYKLVNYLIQGTAAQVLKEKIVQLDLAGLSKYFVLPVHDEFVFDVPDDEVDDFSNEVLTTVSDDTTFRVALTAGAKFGGRWGDHYPAGQVQWETLASDETEVW